MIERSSAATAALPHLARQFDLMRKGCKSMGLDSWEDQFSGYQDDALAGTIKADDIAELIDSDYRNGRDGRAALDIFIKVLLTDALHSIECPNCHNANKCGDYEGPTCDVCHGEGFVPAQVMPNRKPTEAMVLAGGDVLLTACSSDRGNLRPWKPFDVAQVAIKVWTAMCAASFPSTDSKVSPHDG